MHVKDKHSSLIRKSVNYGCKQFYKFDTRGQCYKTSMFIIHKWNFCAKLVRLQENAGKACQGQTL